MLISLKSRARPNRKRPSGYHFESGRLEMAMACCSALPEPLWEGRVSERGGTFECVLPVRDVRVCLSGESLEGSTLPVPFLPRAPGPRTLV